MNEIELTYELIKGACNRRRAEKSFPYAISFLELTKITSVNKESLKTQINDLCKSGRVKFYRNINGIVYLYVDRYF